MTVKFNMSASKMNHIVQNTVSTVLLKRQKQRNGDSETTSSDEEGRVYGIDQIKIGKASNNLDTYPDSILVHRRCFQMAHNKMTC